MAEIATTTAIENLRKPQYTIARRIENIDTLNFYRNQQLQVRITRKNGRAVGYEQLVRWQTTDFINFVGMPGHFISSVPIIEDALLGQLRHELNDVTMRFEAQRFSQYDIQDTQVLIVEAFRPMSAEQVTAYKAIKVHDKVAVRREREAAHLEQQARRLRNHN